MLAEIDGLRGEFKGGLKIVPQAFTRLRKSTLITSTGASTRIEGSKLDDAEVEKVMCGLAVSKFADRDTQEVQGYLETLQNVFDAHSTLLLRESVIKSLHQRLLKYSDKDDQHRGGYKTKENAIFIFETTPAYLVGKEMLELVDWTEEALEKQRFHRLLVIGNFIVEFLKIHPFEDGNGRLSRFLTDLLMLRAGYPFMEYVSHEQIVERRKDEYYVALRKSQETFGKDGDNIEPWLNFFLSAVKEQAEKALAHLAEDNAEDSLSPKQTLVWQHLASVAEASPGDIVKATGIPLGTVRQSLERLVALEKIQRIGRGRGVRYVKV
jgi:Fic family protein